MAIFLIDYENVQSACPLYGIECLNKNDFIILFYSDCAKTISRYYWNLFCSKSCNAKLVKLVRPSKNALDFYISVEVGRFLAFGEKQIAIISNDRGYGAVLDYVNNYLKDCSQVVVRTSSIAEARTIFGSPESERELLIKTLGEDMKIDAKSFSSLKKESSFKALNPNSNSKNKLRVYDFKKMQRLITKLIGGRNEQIHTREFKGLS